MTQFVIYRYPPDYPDDFVLRQLTVSDRGQTIAESEPIYVGSLDGCRAMVPMTAYRYPGNPNPDPVIWEVWFQ